MQKPTSKELLEASLQLNLRLAAVIGILLSREEREQMRTDVIRFVCKAAESGEITTERQIQMVSTVGEGPHEPITKGLLEEQQDI